MAGLLSGLGSSAGGTLGGYLGGKPGKTIGNYTGGVLGHLVQGNDLGASLQGGLSNAGIGLLANYLLPSAGPVVGNAIQTANNLISGKISPPWGSIFGGQSDWTNPYSGYAESVVNTFFPLFGTVLGGFLEGAFGKGQPVPKDNPGYVQAGTAGLNRAEQFKKEGKSAYDVYKWASPRGYVLRGGKDNTVNMLLNPQEATLMNQLENSMLGAPLRRPMKNGTYSTGWYWPQEFEGMDVGRGTGEDTGSWHTPTYYGSLDDLLKQKSLTQGMSEGFSTNRGDPYWEMYLEGNPNRVYKNDEIPWVY